MILAADPHLKNVLFHGPPEEKMFDGKESSCKGMSGFSKLCDVWRFVGAVLRKPFCFENRVLAMEKNCKWGSR